MTKRPLLEEKLTESVIGSFFDVYNTLGFGFLENVYITALEIELAAKGHAVRREAALPIHYKGRRIAMYRADLVVDDVLILEVKSAAMLPPASERQLLNYLRATNLQVGLLLHFGPEPKFYRRVL